MSKAFDVYIAIPYSHGDAVVRHKRFDKATEYLAKLSQERVIAFSPITHSHPLGEWGVPGNWDFWKEIDYRILQSCEEIHVIQLPGWEESTGVSGEVSYAEKLNMKIRYINPNSLEEIND